MRKATEASAGDDKAHIVLKFLQLAKSDVRQDNVCDFISSTTDGTNIALLGSRSELVTLELSSKSLPHLPFPYIKSYLHSLPKNRPLDKLAKAVNLQEVYDNCNALETQQLGLEPVYIAANAQEVPDSNVLAARHSPHLLPNGQMLLAFLTSYGAMELIAKRPEHAFWQLYKPGLNISATLRDQLLPAYEIPVHKINTFKRYQSYMDRSWITMFAWRPTKSDKDNYVLVLGTVTGSLWTLTLNLDASIILSHCELHTLLGRICFMHTFEDLLLVGDSNGLVHLYRFDEAAEEGLTLVKPLWLRPDHMGLQQAAITHCPERDCFYIACCKAAHLLIWCMPCQETGNWLETRFLVGGMKITSLCDVGNSNYAVGTARGQLYLIELNHKTAQLSASKRLVHIEDMDNYQPVGLINSQHKNLLTILCTRMSEFIQNTPTQRTQMVICVGKLDKGDSVKQLSESLMPNVGINCCQDYLVDMRLEIFNRIDMDKYINYAPFDMMPFDGLATLEQLHQLQIKYHIYDALIQVQQSQTPERIDNEKQLLLAMLSTTHMRLCLQHLTNLSELSAFQRQAAQCQLAEFTRLKQQLENQLLKDQPLNGTIKRFLTQMEIHFEQLQQALGITELPATDGKPQTRRCCISYIELQLELEQHYCTICARQALIKPQLLLELYEPQNQLLCPFCHGAFKLELLDA